jgi:hypothetical protein
MPKTTEPFHKLLVTGTGRAGTTFLVQLLTELGLDTGYARGTRSEDYFDHCAAGLESEMTVEASPYIVKNPAFCETLPALLATRCFIIDQVLVPIRQLDQAAGSRIRVGGRDGLVPGGLLGTSDPAAQKGILAERFHALMHSLVANDIPHTLLHFPRLAVDADYAWTKLRFLLPSVDQAAFTAVFRRVSHPELIHRFVPAGASADPGRAAEQFLRRERRKRIRRRFKRVAVAVFLSWWRHGPSAGIPGGSGETPPPRLRARSARKAQVGTRARTSRTAA